MSPQPVRSTVARILLFLSLLLWGLGSVAAQGADIATASAVVSHDSLRVRPVHFNTAELARLKADPQYDYDRDLHVETLWWDRLKHWMQQKLNDLFGTEAGRWAFSHLDWLIILLAAGFLLFYLRKRLFHGGFAAEAAKPRQVLEIGEDITRIDLDGLLAEAENQRDWRMALRYQYLLVLRRLADGGSIRFQPDNTDRDYLRQLMNPAERSTFAELSFLFKWAWFGDAPMDQARYRSLAPAFKGFPSPQKP
ncbi:MAG: DUF4129 domain-containing protein [Bacteroidetes bacterium]|nr:DUF4129 domain-containing protein [Bacteroidota bacterium]